MARVTLFDQTNISPTSRFFLLDKQVTVVGHGLQPDDYITFEAVESNPADRAKACGCDFVPSGVISINSVLELLCPTCGNVGQPVILSPGNPVVILDSPQGFFLRAVYHGTGLETGEVIVRAYDSETGDLTLAMRGCPERDVVWSPTGEYRCAGEDYQERERSSCDDFRWVTRGPVTWSDTGQTRCGDGFIEALRQNQCGDTQWFATSAPIVWSDTGQTRCGEEFIESLRQNQCGETQWFETTTPLTWSATGQTRCGGAFIEELRQNQCGGTQWFTTTTPIVWSPTGQTRCTGSQVQELRQNQCGGTQWQDAGAVVWTDTGETRCRNGVTEEQQANQCGQTRWVSTGGACDEVYVPTLCLFAGARAFRPTDPRDPSATVEVLDTNGNLVGYIYATPRAHATMAVHENICDACLTPGDVLGYAVDWDEEGGQCRCYCDQPPPCEDTEWTQVGDLVCISGTWRRNEVSNCGNTRQVNTGDSCGGCTDVTWTQVGELVCIGGTWRRNEVSNCGNTRQVNTGSPCAVPCVPNYVPTNEYDCYDGRRWRRWIDSNFCPDSEDQWQDVGEEVWTDSGALVCIGDTLQQPQTNNCGDTRMLDTGDPCEDPCDPNSWANVVPNEFRCDGTQPQQRQVSDCGDTRWVNIPRVWVDDSPLTTRCTDVEGVCQYQKRQTEQHGCVTRWLTIEPCAWTDVSPEETRCNGGALEKLQRNQCGAERWVLTSDPATPCGTLTITPVGVCNPSFYHDWGGLPCPTPPQPIQGLVVGCQIAVTGGSGSYTYAWTRDVTVSGFPTTFSGSGTSFTVTDPRAEVSCPYQGNSEGTVTLTVTDTVTLQTGVWTTYYSMEYGV